MLRAYIFVGGPIDGELLDADTEDIHVAVSQRIEPDAQNNLFRSRASLAYPAFVKIIYTKRKCWKGRRIRDFYFAPQGMEDKEALGRYLELISKA